MFHINIAGISTLLLFTNENLLCGYTASCLSIDLLIDVCLHLLVTVSNAAVNIHMLFLCKSMFSFL